MMGVRLLICLRRFRLETFSWRIALMTATAYARILKHEERGAASDLCQTASTSPPSAHGSTNNATPSSGSSTNSNTSVPSQRDTTNATIISSQPFSSLQFAFGYDLMSRSPSVVMHLSIKTERIRIRRISKNGPVPSSSRAMTSCRRLDSSCWSDRANGRSP